MKTFVTVSAAPGTEALATLLHRPPEEWGPVRILKQDRGTTVCLVSSPVGAVVVKHHQLRTWGRWADALIHGSPARRAWRGAQFLHTCGFAVPRPLLAFERRQEGTVRESWYVSEALLHHVQLPVYWREQQPSWSRQQRQQFLNTLAEFLRAFHAAGLYAGDMKDANLLVEEVGQGSWQFYLVDLDRVHHYTSLSWRRRLKNLVQLERTLGRNARVSERLFFLYQYLGNPLPGRTERRVLVEQLLRVRARKDREYARRRTRRPLVPMSLVETDGQPVPVQALFPSRRPVSCCIVCFNEEKNIRRCLESVKWCDEIIIVDSFSSDRTVEICRAYATRLIQRTWPGYVEQKRFALAQATHEWVLNVDADEEVSPALQHEIVAALQRDDPAVDGFYVPRLVYYLGQWWWRGWYPSYRLRLFRKSKVRWGGINPHEKVLLRGHADQLRGNLYHYTYEHIRDHLHAINHLTEIAAHELAIRKRHAQLSDLIWRPVWRFLSFYFLRGCVRDGIPGFFIAVTAAFYVLLKYAKLWERTALNGNHAKTQDSSCRSGKGVGWRRRTGPRAHRLSVSGRT